MNLLSSGSPTFHLIRHGFPRMVNISRNRFSTFRRLPVGEALLTFTNASTLSFRDNDVASYAGVRLPIAVKFEVKAGVRKRPVSGWQVVGNRFRGNATLPPDFDLPGIGTFTTGISMSAGEEAVSEVRVVDNTLAGCARQVRLQADGGDFLRAAFVTGNIGDGIPLVLVGVEAVVVGGNLFSVPGPSVGAAPAGARYCGPGKPTFVAPVGSLYSRTGVGPEQRLWINVDGANLWKHIPFAPKARPAHPRMTPAAAQVFQKHGITYAPWSTSTSPR